MAARLKSKVALVTAAGQGIGRAIAEAFVAEGASVIATDVDESKLAGLASAKRLKLDVRSTGAVEALAKEVAAEFGALDVLVNCAGYVHHGSVLDCSEQDWDFSFDLNVKSMHRTIKAFLPAMLQKQGRLDRQHLIGGVVDPRRSRPLCLWRHQGRRDRADQSGRRRLHQAGHPRERDLSGHDRIALARGPHQGRARRQPANRSPRWSRPSSSASRWAGSASPRRWRRSRVFLASDEASYITGQPHLVDGGMAL